MTRNLKMDKLPRLIKPTSCFTVYYGSLTDSLIDIITGGLFRYLNWAYLALFLTAVNQCIKKDELVWLFVLFIVCSTIYLSKTNIMWTSTINIDHSDPFQMSKPSFTCSKRLKLVKREWTVSDCIGQIQSEFNRLLYI